MPAPSSASRMTKLIPVAQLVQASLNIAASAIDLIHRVNGRHHQASHRLNQAEIQHLNRGGVLVLRDDDGNEVYLML